MTRPTGNASLPYQQLILEHYRRPRNRGTLPDATHRGAASNPVCGDDVVLELRVRGDIIEALAFQGRGCAITQAAASLMTEALTGRTLSEGAEVRTAFAAMMQGNADAGRGVPLGSLSGLADIARFPVRIRCALLPWEALEAAGVASAATG